MKLAIVISNLVGGGAEFVAKTWGEQLAIQGHDVSFIYAHPRKDQADAEGCARIDLRPASFGNQVQQLSRHFKSRSFDVSLSLLPYYNLLSVAAAQISGNSRPRVVVSGRNMEAPFPEVHGDKVKTVRLLGRLLYPRADHFLAISHAVAAEAQALYRIPSDRITVVQNPATFKPEVSRAQGGLRVASHQCRQKRERLNLVVPGRLVEQKNPMVALQVAKELQSDFRDVWLHFYGSGELQSILAEEAGNLKVETIFHGWRSEWFVDLPDDSICLLPSRVEGFGNVLIEAACLGIPSVAPSSALGVSDAIVPGITGQFAPHATVSDLAKAVLAANAIGTVDAPTWLSRFSVESSVGALLDLLQSLLHTEQQTSKRLLPRDFRWSK